MIKLTSIYEALTDDKVEYLSNAIIKMGVSSIKDLNKISNEIERKLEDSENTLNPTVTKRRSTSKEERFFKDYNITDFKKNENGDYIVNNSINLTKFKDEVFPINIQKINGNLTLENSKLKNLKNLPKTITGKLNLTDSKYLTSLIGISKNISGDLILTNCITLNKIDDFPNTVKNVYLYGVKLIDIGNMLESSITGTIYADEDTFDSSDLLDLESKFTVSIKKTKKTKK